jgi:lysophospholipase L1-like esterase
MRRTRLLGLLLLVAGPSAFTASCGSDSGTGPTTPPASTHTVSVTVFYDENADGVLQAAEAGRVPGVEIEVGGRTAVSEKLTGRAVVSGVAAGTQPLSVRTGTLPAFYQAAASSATVAVPQTGSEATIALTLPIGANHPFVYMAFGDSITDGDGSVQHEGGYRVLLRDALRAHFGGQAEIVNEAQSGSRSDTGAERIGLSLNRTRPAYTLVLYGTNDYNRLECRQALPCHTIDALRSMVGAARAARSMPVLATIPPVHPVLAPSDRNDWVARMNELVRPMAREQAVPLADVHAAFMRAPDLSALLADRVHPNDRGYEIIAAEFLAAITKPLGASSSGVQGWLFVPAGGSGPAR